MSEELNDVPDSLTIAIQDMVTAWAGTRAPHKALEAGIRVIVEDCAAARVAELEREVAALREALQVMVDTYPYSVPCFGWESKAYAHRIARAALAPADGGKDGGDAE